MGIKFYCPDGHKLNVKSFLAGKRGICPHCGAKFEIPLAGTSKDRPTAKRAENGRSGDSGVSLGSELGLFEDDLAEWAQTEPSAKAARSANSSGSAPANKALAPAVDPIAEAPEAVWYVHLPDGRKFGPALPGVMRQWLDDGRVTADCLVWRQDWPQWQSAAVVFPEVGKPSPGLAGKSAGPVILSDAADFDVPASGGKVLGTRHGPHPVAARRKARQTTLNITVVLGLVALVLVVVFVIIINRRPAAEGETPQSAASHPVFTASAGEQTAHELL